MKKKLLALVLSLGMAFTIAQPATTYAADDAATTAAIASAETKKLDKEYSDISFLNCIGELCGDRVKLCDIPPYGFAAFEVK